MKFQKQQKKDAAKRAISQSVKRILSLAFFFLLHFFRLGARVAMTYDGHIRYSFIFAGWALADFLKSGNKQFINFTQLSTFVSAHGARLNVNNAIFRECLSEGATEENLHHGGVSRVK